MKWGGRKRLAGSIGAALVLGSTLRACVGPLLVGGAMVGGSLVAVDRRTSGTQLDDEGIELMLEHGTFLVPTLGAPRAVLASAKAGMAIHEASLRKQLEASEHHQRSIQRPIKAGVTVAMGTDACGSRNG